MREGRKRKRGEERERGKEKERGRNPGMDFDNIFG